MRCCANRPNTWMHPTGAHRCTNPLAPRGSSTNAFLLKRGIVFRASRRHMAREMPMVLIDEQSPMSARMRAMLQQLSTTSSPAS